MNVDTEARQWFWSRVGQGDGCWEWLRARTKNGYGHLEVGSKQWYAHRYAWTLFYGPIPDGLAVLHHCDNPPCCRPDHLFLGTQADNVADRNAKGRTSHHVNLNQARGERMPNAKLTADQVREIRRLYRTGQYVHNQLAEQFGVSPSLIGYVIAGRAWAHVSEVAS